MKILKKNPFLEYLSLVMIISYFFIHNIILVIIGITISLYLININLINISLNSNKNKLVIKKGSSELNKNDKTTISNHDNIKITKEDSELTLVETIEELGFIPSIDSNEDINAA